MTPAKVEQLARDTEAADRAAAIAAFGDAEAFPFHWLIQRVAYRGHQTWADGSQREQFVGVDEATFGEMIREHSDAVRRDAERAGMLRAAEMCEQRAEKIRAEAKKIALGARSGRGTIFRDCPAYDVEKFRSRIVDEDAAAIRKEAEK